MKFHRSGRCKRYLAAIAVTICGATATTQNHDATENGVAPRGRYAVIDY